MVDKLLTPDAPIGNLQYKTYSIKIPVNPDIERFVWGAITGICFWTSWKKRGTMEQAEAANYIKEVLASRKEIDFMVGQVVSYLNDTLPDNVLPLDGASYAKADYPELWEVLPSALKDATTLTLPDLRGLFLLGASVDYSFLDSGGEADVLLTVDSMPSHTHTNTPHTHTEQGATLAPNEIGVGVPTPTAIPTPSVTGASSISIDTTGGDQPHNNMPPYFVVKYAIIAKV